MSEAEWIAFLQRPEIPAFNRAMLDNPNDDLPRLVFADWMDENCPDTAVNAAVRASITTDKPREQWVSVQPAGIAMAFVRGRQRLTIQDDPIQSDFYPPSPIIPALLGSKWVGELAFGQVRHEVMSECMSVPGVELIESIELHATRSGVHLLMLLDKPRLQALTALDVDFGLRGLEAADALSRSLTLARLTRLSVGGINTSSAALLPLVRTPLLISLKELRLRAREFSHDFLTVLANCRHLGGLQRLEFVGDIEPTGTAALANSPYLCEAIRAQWRWATDEGEANR